MKDSVILGSGNSRYLKSVADFKTLYPTYDDFAAALVAGTLPIDLNGINQAGFQQLGDGLGKNTLLKDATAALFGLTDTAVPDDVLALIKTLIDNGDASANANANSKAKMQLVSYTGTGSYGSDSPCSVSFSFAPEIIILLARSNGHYIDRDYRGSPGDLTFCTTMIASLASTEYTASQGFWYNTSTGSYAKKSADGKTFFWYHNQSYSCQLNEKNSTYYVLGLG